MWFSPAQAEKLEHDLAIVSPGVQKQMLEEKLYPRVQRYQPDLAGEITGMMLEMDNSELLILLSSELQLKGKVDEAARDEAVACSQIARMRAQLVAMPSAATFATVPPEAQKQIIGEILYPQVMEYDQVLAEAATLFMLGMDSSELLSLLESELQLKIQEALHQVEAAMCRLTVDGLSGVMCRFAVDPSCLWIEVKTSIHDRTSIPVSEQRLFAGVRELEEQEQVGDTCACGDLFAVTLVRTDFVATLDCAPAGVQKQMLGEKLYPRIQRYQPDLAGKITGMMLEMDNRELLMLLKSELRLKDKVDEAVRVLEPVQGPAATAALQKQLLGEWLFPRVHRYQPDLAGKITGMLLEIDNSELLMLLESEPSLKDHVDEAMRVLEGGRR